MPLVETGSGSIVARTLALPPYSLSLSLALELAMNSRSNTGTSRHKRILAQRTNYCIFWFSSLLLTRLHARHDLLHVRPRPDLCCAIPQPRNVGAIAGSSSATHCMNAHDADNAVLTISTLKIETHARTHATEIETTASKGGVAGFPPPPRPSS